MCNIFFYERISTKEERGKQKFTRQDAAADRYEKENNVKILMRFKDDATGTNFNRPEWIKLESLLQSGDCVVFKDIYRFTREYENGYKKYMELLEKGVDLIFIDNPTISTPYIKKMMDVASKQTNRIAKKSLTDTIELLILVELDRAEQEAQIIAKRIKDGIAASDKKSGRKEGQLDKMTPDLEADIRAYLSDRSIKQVDLVKKYGISRNTLTKYIAIIRENY